MQDYRGVSLDIEIGGWDALKGSVHSSFIMPVYNNHGKVFYVGGRMLLKALQ